MVWILDRDALFATFLALAWVEIQYPLDRYTYRCLQFSMLLQFFFYYHLLGKGIFGCTFFDFLLCNVNGIQAAHGRIWNRGLKEGLLFESLCVSYCLTTVILIISLNIQIYYSRRYIVRYLCAIQKWRLISFDWKIELFEAEKYGLRVLLNEQQ